MAFRALVNGGETKANAVLKEDIALSNDWTPISIDTTVANQYAGVFDGNGKKITGLKISAKDTNQGLFGAVNGATIKNLSVEGSVSSSKAYVGGIVGKLTQGTIENCSFSGSVSTSVTTTSGWAGGITGYSGNSNTQKGTITGCVNRANVTGGVAGGIAGGVKASTVSNCYNKGEIKGVNRSAGMIGQAQSALTISNCYNIGEITGRSSNKADIVAFQMASTRFDHCYYSSGGALYNNANATPASEAECGVIEKDSLLSKIGSAFTADSNNINDGYPILAWEAGEAPAPKEPKIQITGANPLYLSNVGSNPSETVSVNYVNMVDTPAITWTITSGDDVISLDSAEDAGDSNSKVVITAKKAGKAAIKAATADGTFVDEANIDVYPFITSIALDGTAVVGEELAAKVTVYGGSAYDDANYPALTTFTWKYFASSSDQRSNPSGGTIIKGNGRSILVPEEAAGKWLTVSLSFNGENKTPGSPYGVTVLAKRIPVTDVAIEGASGDGEVLNAKTGASLKAIPTGEDGAEPTNVSYQWQQCTEKDKSEWTDLKGETKQTFTIADEQSAMDAWYRVVVSGDSDSVVTSKTIQVTEASDQLKEQQEADAKAKEAVDAAKKAFDDELGALRPSFKTDKNIVEMVQAKVDGYQGCQGVTVSLQGSNEPDWIKEDGTIQYNKGALDSWGMNSKNVSTVFTFSKGTQSVDSKERMTTVGWDLDYYAGKMAEEAQGLTADKIKGDNASLDEATENLTLPQCMTDSSRTAWSKITWTSSNEDVIKIDQTGYDSITDPKQGTVTRQAEDTVVTLTATFNANDANLNSNVEKAADITPTVITFDVTVKKTEVHIPTEEELQEILDTYYTADRLTDSASGAKIDTAAVTGDIQLPVYTRIKDTDNKPVFENKEITVTSDQEDVIKINGYKAAVDRYAINEDTTVLLTVSYQKKDQDITVSKTIPVTVKPLTEEEIADELALMDKAKAAYEAAVLDGQDKSSVKESLHGFQKIYLDEAGNVKVAYDTSVTAEGIKADGYWGAGESEQMEASGYNKFKSSAPAVLQHENLVLTQPETDTVVTVTSWLTSEKYGETAAKYPENQTLQKLYKQEVSVTVTVKGSKDPADNPPVDNPPVVNPPVVNPTEDIHVLFTFSMKGSLQVVNEQITVGDEDHDGALTINDAMIVGHREFAPNGLNDYEYGTTQWGLGVKKLWGDASSNFGYYVNDQMANNVADPIAEADEVYAWVYQYTYEEGMEGYAYFDQKAAKGKEGDRVTLKLSYQSEWDKDYNPVYTSLAGASIGYYSGTDFVELGKTDASGAISFAAPIGKVIVTAKAPEGVRIVPPYSVLDMEKAASSGSGEGTGSGQGGEGTGTGQGGEGTGSDQLVKAKADAILTIQKAAQEAAAGMDEAAAAKINADAQEAIRQIENADQIDSVVETTAKALQDASAAKDGADLVQAKKAAQEEILKLMEEHKDNTDVAAQTLQSIIAVNTAADADAIAQAVKANQEAVSALVSGTGSGGKDPGQGTGSGQTGGSEGIGQTGGSSGSGTSTGGSKSSVSSVKAKTAAAKKLTVKKLKVKSSKKKLVVTWKKTKGAKGYQVQYQQKGKKWKTLKLTSKAKVTSKKLKKGKKYKVRVRTYTKVNGKKVYGKWTKAKTVKCK